MELTLKVTPIVVTVEKENVFDNPLNIIYKAVVKMEKINGIVRVGGILQKNNYYMLTVVGNIGNRSELILRNFIENGCKTANYISDDEAESFICEQDIYS